MNCEHSWQHTYYSSWSKIFFWGIPFIYPLCSYDPLRCVHVLMCDMPACLDCGIEQVQLQCWFGAKKKNYCRCKQNGYPKDGDIKCHTTLGRKSPIAEQSGAVERSMAKWEWSDQSWTEVSAEATPPLPSGAYRNRRSKKAEKILSSTRYLPVTWHHHAGCRKGGKKSEGRPFKV